MKQTAFDGLQVVRREWECAAGCSEVCRTPEGTDCIRLRIRSAACQREFLRGGALPPVRLTQGLLEVLLPCREGGSLDCWLESRPGLARRREACLSLTARCVESRLPPVVTALSALPGNLRFSGDGAWLLPLPNWGGWRPEGVPAAPQAAAVLCLELLTRGLTGPRSRRCPVELKLLAARAEQGGYQDWGQLQRDLADIPEDLLPFAHSRRAARRRGAEILRRVCKPAVCAAAALLLAAAVLSLAGAWSRRAEQTRPPWPGMTPIGTQELR